MIANTRFFLIDSLKNSTYFNTLNPCRAQLLISDSICKDTFFDVQFQAKAFIS